MMLRKWSASCWMLRQEQAWMRKKAQYDHSASFASIGCSCRFRNNTSYTDAQTQVFRALYKANALNMHGWPLQLQKKIEKSTWKYKRSACNHQLMYHVSEIFRTQQEKITSS
jgi:hypothetical protein